MLSWGFEWAHWHSALRQESDVSLKRFSTAVAPALRRLLIVSSEAVRRHVLGDFVGGFASWGAPQAVHIATINAAHRALFLWDSPRA